MAVSGERPDSHPPRQGSAGGIHTLEHLVEHLSAVVLPSTVVVCVGNELCGDDGAGPAVARTVTGTVPWEVIDAQTVPESFLMRIVQRRPESVLLIDAVDLHASPGAVDVLEADQLSGQGPSTHGPAPLAFLELLRMLHPCRAAILAIQPKQTEPGQPLSEPVAGAVVLVTEALRALAARGGTQAPG